MDRTQRIFDCVQLRYRREGEQEDVAISVNLNSAGQMQHFRGRGGFIQETHEGAH